MIIVRAGAAELIHSVATDAWRKFTAYEGVIGFVVGRGGEHLKLAEVQPVFGCFRQNLAVERGNALLPCGAQSFPTRSEEHTSELQSLMRISYAVFCLKKKKRH